MSFVPCLLIPEVILATICDASSVAVSPSVVVAAGNIALSAVALQNPINQPSCMIVGLDR